MKKLPKILALVSILVIPLLIAVFLKIFGNNEFDIPVYYETGTSHPFKECADFGNEHFFAKELLLDKTQSDNISLLIFFEEDENFSVNQLTNILSRIQDTFGEKPVETILYGKQNSDNQNDNLDKFISLTENEFINKMHCQAVTDTVNQFILVDKTARVRGYYGVELDEVDRMIVEAKILLDE